MSSAQASRIMMMAATKVPSYMTHHSVRAGWIQGSVLVFPSSFSTPPKKRLFGSGSNVDVTLSKEDRRCIDLEDQYGAFNYSPLPVVLARGEGKYYTEEA